MKTLIIKFLGAGILTLTVIGVVLMVKSPQIVLLTNKPTTSQSKELLSEKTSSYRAPAEEGKTIVFNYNHNGKPLKLTFKGVSWETALKEGAHKCMDYYTDGKRAKVDEELYLDLIDVCVNPR